MAWMVLQDGSLPSVSLPYGSRTSVAPANFFFFSNLIHVRREGRNVDDLHIHPRTAQQLAKLVAPHMGETATRSKPKPHGVFVPHASVSWTAWAGAERTGHPVVDGGRPMARWSRCRSGGWKGTTGTVWLRRFGLFVG